MISTQMPGMEQPSALTKPGSKHCHPVSTPTNTPTKGIRLSALLTTTLTSEPINPPIQFAHTQPMPGNPVPMDIDAAKCARKHPPICFHCRKLGHFVPDCPLPDIWSLERGEAEVLMEQLNARMVEINLLASAFSEDEPKILEVVKDPLLGFPIGSTWKMCHCCRIIITSMY